MAEVDTLMLSQEHSDIRREQAEQASNIRQQNADRSAEIRYDIGQGVNEVIKEGIKGDNITVTAIKDSKHDVATRINDATNSLSQQVDAIDDTLTAHLFTLARESADNRAQITALGYQVRDGFASVGKDAEISVLKSTIEGQKNTQYLADKISNDGEKTRALIADLKNADLNRMLIERTTELTEERHGRRHWRYEAENHMVQGQWASLQSQMQAFQSQIQDTRQSMVNLGTMIGSGQSATSNNVR